MMSPGRLHFTDLHTTSGDFGPTHNRQMANENSHSFATKDLDSDDLEELSRTVDEINETILQNEDIIKNNLNSSSWFLDDLLEKQKLSRERIQKLQQCIKETEFGIDASKEVNGVKVVASDEKEVSYEYNTDLSSDDDVPLQPYMTPRQSLLLASSPLPRSRSPSPLVADSDVTPRHENNQCSSCSNKTDDNMRPYNYPISNGKNSSKSNKIHLNTKVSKMDVKGKNEVFSITKYLRTAYPSLPSETSQVNQIKTQKNNQLVELINKDLKNNNFSHERLFEESSNVVDVSKILKLSENEQFLQLQTDSLTPFDTLFLAVKFLAAQVKLLELEKERVRYNTVTSLYRRFCDISCSTENVCSEAEVSFGETKSQVKEIYGNSAPKNDFVDGNPTNLTNYCDSFEDQRSSYEKTEHTLAYVDRLKVLNHSLHKDNQVLTKENKILKEDCVFLRIEIDRVKIEYESLKHEMKAVRNENNSLKRENSSLKHEKKAIKSKLSRLIDCSKRSPSEIRKSSPNITSSPSPSGKSRNSAKSAATTRNNARKGLKFDENTSDYNRDSYDRVKPAASIDFSKNPISNRPLVTKNLNISYQSSTIPSATKYHRKRHNTKNFKNGDLLNDSAHDSIDNTFDTAYEETLKDVVDRHSPVSKLLSANPPFHSTAIINESERLGSLLGFSPLNKSSKDRMRVTNRNKARSFSSTEPSLTDSLEYHNSTCYSTTDTRNFIDGMRKNLLLTESILKES